MSSNVAVVIVTYNSADVIVPCLRALEGISEVVVTDNASRDETCRRVQEEAPWARLIRNKTNRGFAAAVNQGIRATTNPFVLLLNPDTVLRTGLEPMVDDCLLPEVGAVGGKLVDSDGKPQTGFNVRSFPTATALTAEVLLLNRIWPSNRVNRRYRRLDFDAEQPQEVDQPAGAFLMVRRDVLETVGYLDEDFYPLWFEDLDLCLRIRRAGFLVRYNPSSVAEHAGAHSIPALAVEQRYLAWYGNLLLFIFKHFSTTNYLWLRSSVLFGLLCRWVACLLGAGTDEERRACQKAIRVLAETRPLPFGRTQMNLQRTTGAEY